MPFVTQANVPVGTAWTLVAENAAEVILQLISTTASSVIIAIADSPPAANSFDGNVIYPVAGRDSFRAGGLTSEKIYARRPAYNSPTAAIPILAVVKG